jgi:type IV secretion system protein VirB6
MADKEQSDNLFATAMVIIVAIVIVLVLLFTILLSTGRIKLSNGCLKRYEFSNSNDEISVFHTSYLMANGYYASNSQSPQYGQWLNTEIYLDEEDEIFINVQGNISLCKAYLQKNNLYQDSSTDDFGAKIEIPRVEDYNAAPVSLIFDAKKGGWRNLTQLTQGDSLIVSINKDQKHDQQVNIYNPFKKSIDNTTCNQGYREYKPMCGRFSIYKASETDKKYTIGCGQTRVPQTCDCDWQCHGDAWDAGEKSSICRGNKYGGGSKAGYIIGKDASKCEAYCPDDRFCPDNLKLFGWCGCGNWTWKARTRSDQTCDIYSWNNTITGEMPRPYRFDGWYVSPRFENINDLIQNHYAECNDGSKDWINGEFQNQRYFWYSADTATGLLYRLSDNDSVDYNWGNKSNAQIDDKVFFPANSDYVFAKINVYDKYSDIDKNYQNDKRQIMIKTDYASIEGQSKYLQYRFHSSSDNSTGGYVLNIKQTKCKRKNGNAFTDTFNNRGQIQYIVSAVNKNPNTITSQLNPVFLSVDASGNSKITGKTGTRGMLWIRIYNNPDDYKDSYGSYKITFSKKKNIVSGGFLHRVFTPVMNSIKTTMFDAASRVFQNMTCYKLTDKSKCSNFFNYIKAILTIYIALYGIMFMIGLTEISQSDIIIRIIKVVIIAKLLTGDTFEFFAKNLFPILFNFVDQIILNVSGYSYTPPPASASDVSGVSDGIAFGTSKIFDFFLNTNSSTSTAFVFLDEIMSKIFFDLSFIAQLFALIIMGINGIIYFIFIVLSLVIITISTLRAIAVYFMSFIAMCLLIALSPIFLSFMLFEFTKPLFDNWLKAIFHYMIEPVIMMVGLIVLVKLFTLYLDNAIGYSVCWKCALVFKIPFMSTLGIDLAFLNMPIFCLTWFAPWGFDPNIDYMGINLIHVVALLLISYCTYSYISLVGTIASKLSGSMTPSGADMGAKMADKMEQKQLGKIGLDRKSIKKIKKRINKRRMQNKARINKEWNKMKERQEDEKEKQEQAKKEAKKKMLKDKEDQAKQKKEISSAKSGRSKTKEMQDAPKQKVSDVKDNLNNITGEQSVERNITAEPSKAPPKEENDNTSDQSVERNIKSGDTHEPSKENDNNTNESQDKSVKEVKKEDKNENLNSNQVEGQEALPQSNNSDGEAEKTDGPNSVSPPPQEP